jgi:hypothetical protein
MKKKYSKERLRSKAIKVRFNQPEYEKLLENMKKRNFKNISDYIRYIFWYDKNFNNL